MADDKKGALNDGINDGGAIEEVMDTSNPPDSDQDMGEGGVDQGDGPVGDGSENAG